MSLENYIEIKAFMFIVLICKLNGIGTFDKL